MAKAPIPLVWAFCLRSLRARPLLCGCSRYSGIIGIVLNGVQLLLLPRTGRYNLMNSGVDKLAAIHITIVLACGLILFAILAFAFALGSTWRARQRAGLYASFQIGLLLPVLVIALFLIGILMFLENPRGLPCGAG